MSLSFRLFGIPIEVQLGFWIAALLLGPHSSKTAPNLALPMWVAIVLVSVIIHELGHALMYRRFKVTSEITLHWMGGHTLGRILLPLTRKQHILVSLAGPFAEFAVGIPALVAYLFIPGLRPEMGVAPTLAQWALMNFIWVNIAWAAINLIPVLPWDGGHVLEHALGPRRARLSAGISLVIGVTVAVLFAVKFHMIWGAFIFGLGALQSLQRFLSPNPTPVVETAARPESESEVEEPLPGPVAARLVRARHALAADRPREAIEIAEGLLGDAAPSDVMDGAAEKPEAIPDRAKAQALDILGWAHLAEGHPIRAEEAITKAEEYGKPDPALVGAVRFAKGDLGGARSVLERARAAHDERKEVVGTLIQVLIAEKEIARAAAIAYDILDSLSDEDARRMADIARDARAFVWTGRLYEGLFERDGRAEDAYEAARAFSEAGDLERAIGSLKKAVEAGFSDRARAWSDSALQSLRDSEALEAVVPPPNRT